MTILIFPSNPSVGQSYNAPNGTEYIFDGVKWTVFSTNVLPLNFPVQTNNSGKFLSTDGSNLEFVNIIQGPHDFTFSNNIHPSGILGHFITSADSNNIIFESSGPNQSVVRWYDTNTNYTNSISANPNNVTISTQNISGVNSWLFNADGSTLLANGMTFGNGTISLANNTSLKINTNSHQWSFDLSGNFVLPPYATILTNTGKLIIAPAGELQLTPVTGGISMLPTSGDVNISPVAGDVNITPTSGSVSISSSTNNTVAVYSIGTSASSTVGWYSYDTSHGGGALASQVITDKDGVHVQVLNLNTNKNNNVALFNNNSIYSEKGVINWQFDNSGVLTLPNGSSICDDPSGNINLGGERLGWFAEFGPNNVDGTIANNVGNMFASAVEVSSDGSLYLVGGYYPLGNSTAYTNATVQKINTDGKPVWQKILSSPTQQSNVQATISGTTLTVANYNSGPNYLTVGQVVTGTNISQNTVITGIVGSNSWSVNNSQNMMVLLRWLLVVTPRLMLLQISWLYQVVYQQLYQITTAQQSFRM
jgi:hypothetical protein